MITSREISILIDAIDDAVDSAVDTKQYLEGDELQEHESYLDEICSLQLKLRQQLQFVNFQGHVYVDIPDKNTLGDDDNSWTNVHNANSVAEAVAWVNDNIGGCDEFGNINLLTLGERIEA